MVDRGEVNEAMVAPGKARVTHATTKALITFVAAGGLLLSSAAAPPGDTEPDSGSRPGPDGPSPPDPDTGRERSTTTVTLITGHEVLVQQTADGPLATVSADADDEEGWSYSHRQVGDQITIVPDDVRDLVPDRLDPRLFDVTLLAEMDAGDEIPVIVELVDTQGHTLSGDASALQTLASDFAATTGVDVDLQLNSISSVSADVSPAQFDALLDSLEQEPAVSSVNKVWLSGPVWGALDESTGQIGAPQAWDLGLTGDGVTVAVLDSGIDTGHPDLEDQVTGEQNFTDAPDSADPFGHGTHVAGIVAGTGTANPDYTQYR